MAQRYANNPCDDVSAIQLYVTGGNAIFTLVSPATRRRYTYKMVRSKSSDRQYEIRLLQGDDLTSLEAWHFIGRFYDELPLTANYPRIWFKSYGWCYYPGHWITVRDGLLYSDQAIAWLLLRTSEYLKKGCQFWMSDRCARCGRLLTVPESIKTGFGPKCGGKI
mgnify:CR=1 FL=1